MRRRTLTNKRTRCGSRTAKHKLNVSERYWRLAGGASVGVVGLIGVMMLCPITSDSTNALDNTARSAVSLVSVDATASLSVSLDPKVEMEISPDTSTGKFSYGSAKLSVTTNNPEGYSIFMQTEDGKSTMQSADTNSTSVISSITTDTVGTGFTGNTWGYTIDKNAVNEISTYKPIPINMTTAIESGGSATELDSYNLGFGAHITNALPSGTYYNNVVVSVVANPRVISTLSDLVFMQDMTSQVCAASAEGSEKQLIDIRDMKKYYVTKLKDGNCWMTQNLAYEFKKGTVLTPDDSDVTTNWTVPKDAKNIGTAGDMSYTSTDMWVGNGTGVGHGAYGNYYAFSAATANSGSSIGAGPANATSSICPKGWQLPRSGDSLDSPSTTEKTFARLFKAYGVASNAAGSSIIQTSPLYFVLSGDIYTDSGTLRSDGNYWSATVNSSGNGNILLFDNSYVRPDGTRIRYIGATVRCVAR